MGKDRFTGHSYCNSPIALTFHAFSKFNFLTDTEVVRPPQLSKSLYDSPVHKDLVASLVLLDKPVAVMIIPLGEDL